MEEMAYRIRIFQFDIDKMYGCLKKEGRGGKVYDIFGIKLGPVAY